LNAPQATFAAKVTREDDGSFIVDRETDAGKKPYDIIFSFAHNRRTRADKYVSILIHLLGRNGNNQTQTNNNCTRNHHL
jgi:hypothetical protein